MEQSLSASSSFDSDENDDYVSRNASLQHSFSPSKVNLSVNNDHPRMQAIQEDADPSLSHSESFGSVGSPSPTTNARRIMKKSRLAMSKNSSFKRNSLKRTVSIINNQFKNLQALREKKPIIMMKRVEPNNLQNASEFKFKKFIKQPVDSNPHLKNLRRRMSIK